MNEIEAAVVALGDRPLEEQELRQHIDPLFSRVLRNGGDHIYLANHSLGRPLDRTEKDIREGLALWYSDLDDAWESWQAEMLAFRSRVAGLINAEGAHCIVPKASAGQGLRAVLNRHTEPLRVIATRSEFSSIDLILKAYEARGRIDVHWVGPSAQRLYQPSDFTTALQRRADLLVVSLVFFDTGQFLADIDVVVAAAKAQNRPSIVGPLPCRWRTAGGRHRNRRRFRNWRLIQVSARRSGLRLALCPPAALGQGAKNPRHRLVRSA